MTPDMESLAYADLIRVRDVMAHLDLAVLTAESSAKQAGREDAAKALHALRGAMLGFRDDVIGMLDMWGEE